VVFVCWKEARHVVQGTGWVAAGTVVVVERAASGPELAWSDGWRPWPSRRYGDTRIELAERTELP